MTSLDKNKPCLVETSQGFSVKYKERFLYSKYNPEKNILQIVENISILPGTLILCFSPLLGYGINNLIQKLPNDCILLGCEIDEELFSITKEFCSKLEETSSNRFYLLSPSEVKKLPILLETEAKNYLQKRNDRDLFELLITFDSCTDDSMQLIRTVLNVIGEKNIQKCMEFTDRQKLPMMESSRC